MSRLRFQPTRARILVEPVHASAYIGRLVLPENARESKPAEAVVVALGPTNALPIKVGDRVLTERYNGSSVRIGEREYRLLEPIDILAYVGEDVVIEERLATPSVATPGMTNAHAAALQQLAS